MSVSFLSGSPIEHELYVNNLDMQQTMDSVAKMLCDLSDEPLELTIVLVVNDETEPNEYTLAFSGTDRSLEFYPDGIDVSRFNDGDEEVLQTFPRESVNAATTWLFNNLE